MIDEIYYLYNSDEQKFYLNLDNETYSILHDDMLSFKEIHPTKAGFLNNIISSYHNFSNANPLIYLKNKIISLEKAFNINTISKDILEQLDLEKKAIILWNDHYQNDIVPILNKKGTHILFRLDNNNIELLNFHLSYESSFTSSNINAYENNASLYLKYLLYSYSRLPYVYREAIAYSSTIIELNRIIQANLNSDDPHSLTISSRANKFIIKPYKIFYDEKLNHCYLLAMSKKYNSEDGFIPASFRISKIFKLKERFDRPSGKITKSELALLTKSISSNGLSYLIGIPTKFEIYLTEVGYNKYLDEITSRPIYDDIKRIEDGYVLTFTATSHQIITYFLRFGKHCRILSPEEMKNTFIKIYNDALMAYKK